MCPNQPEHTFDPQKIRGRPDFDQGIFLTHSDEIFFDQKSKKLKKLGFLAEIFQTQTKAKDG